MSIGVGEEPGLIWVVVGDKEERAGVIEKGKMEELLSKEGVASR